MNICSSKNKQCDLPTPEIEKDSVHVPCSTCYIGAKFRTQWFEIKIATSPLILAYSKPERGGGWLTRKHYATFS